MMKTKTAILLSALTANFIIALHGEKMDLVDQNWLDVLAARLSSVQ